MTKDVNVKASDAFAKTSDAIERFSDIHAFTCDAIVGSSRERAVTSDIIAMSREKTTQSREEITRSREEITWTSFAIAMSRDVDGAKEVFRAFKLRAGSVGLKGLGDEAVQIVVQEAPERAKADYVVARKGSFVAGIGDEELVLDPTTPAEKQAPLRLTRDEKMAKLVAWLAGVK